MMSMSMLLYLPLESPKRISKPASRRILSLAVLLPAGLFGRHSRSPLADRDTTNVYLLYYQ
jgi:hypothetical protein